MKKPDVLLDHGLVDRTMGLIELIGESLCGLRASGYSDAQIHLGPDGIEIPLLAKPFNRRTLLARVQEVLGGEAVAAEPLRAPSAP